MSDLTQRIIRDHTCVVEGDFDELNQVMSTLSLWRMSEECKERNVDHKWINKLSDAQHAVMKRVNELRDAE